MFNDVGNELKNWARLIVILLTIPAVLAGIVLLIVFVEQEMILLGVIIALVASVLGYILARLSAILLYAFGELVACATSIDERLEKIGSSPEMETSQPQNGNFWNPNAFSSYK